MIIAVRQRKIDYHHEAKKKIDYRREVKKKWISP
jgi:hypothetical protein